MNDFDERRRTGIGGSDAAAALGLSPWKTAFQLYLEKIGEPEPTIESEAFLWGRLLEPLVASEYGRRTGRELAPSGMLRHPNHGWMIGHPDRLVVGEPSRIVEIKTATGWAARDWGDGIDAIPAVYVAQCCHYIALTGAAICDVAVLIGGSDFRVYSITADPEITQLLIDAEARFWQCVERREPPEPTSPEDAARRWGRLSRPGAVIAGEAELDAITALHRVKSARKDLAEAEDLAQLTIMQALGDDGDTLIDADGRPLATWKLDKGRQEFTVPAREPQRRFLVK
jgi:putative phage-type endonuclease